MKKLFVILGLVIFCQVAVCQVTSKVTSFGMPYLEFKNPDCVGCPVILFLSGSGERGNGGTELNRLYNAGLPRVLKLAGKTYIDGFSYVICPQQSTSKGWDQDLVTIVEYFTSTYDCSTGFFVTGLSLGASATWLASYSTELPDSITTAIIPVSGGGDYKSAAITTQRHIPVWALHGKADNTVPVSTGQRAVNGMNACNPKPNPAPIFTLITGGTHSNNTWDKVYSLTVREDCPEMGGITIYDWMLKYAKKPPINPVVKDPVKSAYFVESEGKLIIETESGKTLRFTPD